MIKNLWSRIELKCNCHSEPVPMYVYENSMSPFYACPKYMRKDDAHPNGHEENERGCANRISFNDVEHLVDKLGKVIAEDENNGVVADYTGLRLKWKTIDAVVLKYTPKKIVLGIKNSKQIAVWM